MRISGRYWTAIHANTGVAPEAVCLNAIAGVVEGEALGEALGEVRGLMELSGFRSGSVTVGIQKSGARGGWIQ